MKKDKVSLLKEQINELERIIELKDIRIRELEIIRVPLTTGWTTIAVNPCNHEYPNPWLGTVPPTCYICGEQAQPLVTFT